MFLTDDNIREPMTNSAAIFGFLVTSAALASAAATASATASSAAAKSAAAEE